MQNNFWVQPETMNKNFPRPRKNLSKDPGGLKWAKRFLSVAKMVSEWSKDPGMHCGAVIVRPNGTIASTGYNGFPRGCDDDESLYNNREVKLERVIHAELNAILHCPERPLGYTMYCWPPGFGPSCQRCAAHIIQSGISRVVWYADSKCTQPGSERWKASCSEGLKMFNEAHVEYYGLDVEQE